MQLRHSQVRFAEGERVSSTIDLSSDRLVAVVLLEDVVCRYITIEARHADVVNTVEIPWSLVIGEPIPGDAGWNSMLVDVPLMLTRFVRDAAGPAFDLGLVLAPRP